MAENKKKIFFGDYVADVIMNNEKNNVEVKIDKPNSSYSNGVSLYFNNFTFDIHLKSFFDMIDEYFLFYLQSKIVNVFHEHSKSYSIPVDFIIDAESIAKDLPSGVALIACLEANNEYHKNNETKVNNEYDVTKIVEYITSTGSEIHVNEKMFTSVEPFIEIANKHGVEFAQKMFQFHKSLEDQLNAVKISNIISAEASPKLILESSDNFMNIIRVINSFNTMSNDSREVDFLIQTLLRIDKEDWFNFGKIYSSLSINIKPPQTFGYKSYNYTEKDKLSKLSKKHYNNIIDKVTNGEFDNLSLVNLVKNSADFEGHYYNSNFYYNFVFYIFSEGIVNGWVSSIDHSKNMIKNALSGREYDFIDVAAVSQFIKSEGDEMTDVDLILTLMGVNRKETF